MYLYITAEPSPPAPFTEQREPQGLLPHHPGSKALPHLPWRDGHLGQSGVGYFLLGQHCWATLVAPLLLVSAIISTSQELLHLALTLPLWAHTQKVKSAPWSIWKQLCLALVFSSSKRDTGVISRYLERYGKSKGVGGAIFLCHCNHPTCWPFPFPIDPSQASNIA